MVDIAFIPAQKSAGLRQTSDRTDDIFPMMSRNAHVAHELLSRLHGRKEAEFSLLVSDPYQHQGLGSERLHLLLEIGREDGLPRISAEMLPVNHTMQQLCNKLAFAPRDNLRRGKAWLDLNEAMLN